MGGDGITKVVSRRLPRDIAEEEGEDRADGDEGEGGTLSAVA